MPVRLRGGTSGVDADVDGVGSALRTTLRPNGYGTGGSYHLTAKSGTMAAGLSGGSTIYSFRVASASLLVAVRRIQLSAWSLGTGFTAGLGTFEMWRATAWTVADTAGNTVTITSGNGVLRSTMPSIAALAEIRKSDTAAVTAGTRTLDAQPMQSLNVNVPTTQNYAFVPAPTMLFQKLPGEYPLVCAAEQGFVIRATVPATGTWTFAITTEWDELDTY